MTSLSKEAIGLGERAVSVRDVPSAPSLAGRKAIPARRSGRRQTTIVVTKLEPELIDKIAEQAHAHSPKCSVEEMTRLILRAWWSRCVATEEKIRRGE